MVMLISSPEFTFYYHFGISCCEELLPGAGGEGGPVCLEASTCVFGFLGLFWAIEISTSDTDVSTDVEGDNGGLIGCN